MNANITFTQRWRVAVPQDRQEREQDAFMRAFFLEYKDLIKFRRPKFISAAMKRIGNRDISPEAIQSYQRGEARAGRRRDSNIDRALRSK